jgi:hypothetical protein
MNDTPDHIRHLYANFIMGKSDMDRFRMGFEMADFGPRVVEESIKQQYPDWSAGELKVAVFERIYRTDFSAEEMARIKASFLESYNRK